MKRELSIFLFFVILFPFSLYAQDVKRDRTFIGSALYGYMNGGSDLYYEYDFIDLRVLDLHYNGADYTLEIYKMNTEDDAFGIYSIHAFGGLVKDSIFTFDIHSNYQIQTVIGNYYISLVFDRPYKPINEDAIDIIKRFVDLKSGSESYAVSIKNRYKIDISGNLKYIRGPLSMAAADIDPSLLSSADLLTDKKGFWYFKDRDGTAQIIQRSNTLSSVVVSANRVNVSNFKVPVTISVIDKDIIESSGYTSLLPVLSENIPGLFVTRKGVLGYGVAQGAAGVINIRGIGQSNKVLMVVDGKPQFAGIFGHALPDLYVSSDVERVEVIRGPGSLIYGSNAMGGVVNIKTKGHDSEGFGGGVRLSLGSYNTQKYMANTGYRKGRLSSFISFNRDQTDGHRDNSKFWINNGYFKLNYDIDSSLSIGADISIADIYNQNPGEEHNPKLDNNMDLLRGNASVSINKKREKGAESIILYYNYGEHKIDDGYSIGETPKNYYFNSKDYIAGVSAFKAHNFTDNTLLTVGIDFKEWGGEAWNSAKSDGNRVDLVDKKVSESAIYFIVQQSIVPRVWLNGGLRYEYNSVFRGQFIPQFGLSWRDNNNSYIKFNFSKGFRSPTIREMYMFPPQNPDLKPERLFNYELTFGKIFSEGKLSSELNLFYIDASNIIELVRGGGAPKNLNSGEFFNKGVDFTVDYRVCNNMSANLNYGYLYMSRPLINSPKHKLGTSITYSPGSAQFRFSSQYVDGVYIDEAKTKKESYLLINLRASYSFIKKNPHLRLFADVENLTDRDYSINYGYPMPGIIFNTGLELRF